MFEAILKYSFMQNAVIGILLASVIAGVMGTVIVEKKLVSMSGGIAHSSFAGIGAAYFLGIEPIIGGLIFSVFASVSVGQLNRRTNAGSDTVINMFWAAGMALGILFIALTPGYPPDMTTYLFGDVLTINNIYIKIMIGLTLVVLMIIFGFFNYWKLYLFDEEYASIIGIWTELMEVILYIIIAVTIVLLIKVVGIILAIAMLTIPPAIGKNFSHNLRTVMGISAGLGVIFGMLGLTVSYYMNIPSGATIILIAAASYIISLGVKKVNGKAGRSSRGDHLS